jgi:glucose-1-phosphate adenylyltransferase
VACVRLPADEARGNFGVMEVDEEGRIVGFEEKPREPRTIPGTSDCLASMGIYLFQAGCLRKALDNDHLDFGKDIIPMLIREGGAVYAYDFTHLNVIPEWEFLKHEGVRRKELVPRSSDSDYWRDVGTLEQYWLANLDLVQPKPRFNVYGENFPLYSAPLHFPPAKFVHEIPGRTGIAVNSIVADGVIVSGATVRESVLGSGVYVHSWAMIERSVLLGGALRGGTLTETSIGRRCRVRNAIIDKNVHLSENVSIGYDRDEDERRGLKTAPITGSSEHVVVVPKDFNL